MKERKDISLDMLNRYLFYVKLQEDIRFDCKAFLKVWKNLTKHKTA